MTSLNSRLNQLQRRVDEIDSPDKNYLLSESDCERFVSPLFRGHGGVLFGEYCAWLLMRGTAMQTIRALLREGYPVIGHRNGAGPFIMLSEDTACDAMGETPTEYPCPPIPAEIEALIEMVSDRLAIRAGKSDNTLLNEVPDEEPAD